MNQSGKVLDSSDPGQASVKGCGNESLYFIRGFRFLDEMNDYHLEVIQI
jgi:hypothetical protein